MVHRLSKETLEKIRKECDLVREYIKNINPEIEESTTKKNITFKYKNRNLCEIKPRTNSFVFGWRRTDNDWIKERSITDFDKVKDIIETEGNVLDFYKILKEK